MKRAQAFTGVVGILLLLVPARSLSLPNPTGLLIVEVQAGSLTSASEEFIELYNASGVDADISEHKLEYFSASSDFSSPTRSIQLHGTLYAGKRYLVASTGYLIDKANDSFTGGLSKTGGHLRLVSPQVDDATKQQVHDLVGWGTALHPEHTAAPAPADGSSLQRKTDDVSNFIDTDNNAADFLTNQNPTPESTNTPPLPDPEQPTSTGPSQTTPDPEPSTTAIDEEIIPDATTQLAPLQITELLPNPAPPATDNEDEFVELYNPNNEPVDLAGYKLQTGNSFSYSHTFVEGTIAAKAYMALKVTDTGALLANSGGKARLIHPNGSVVSETAAYDDAGDGEAWALLSGNWAWTTSPTPDAANVLTTPAVKAATTTKAKSSKTTTKKPTVKTASTKKKATTTPKKLSNASNTAASAAMPKDDGPGPLNNSVLAAVSALAVGYAAYEYRHDIANRLYQLRRYRATRRAARQAAQGK